MYDLIFQLLAKLLKSKNPDDLQAANRLIKNMVKQVILAFAGENQQSAYAKTKMQISCAVTAQLISVFVFAVINSTIPLLGKSCFCDCSDRFVLDLDGNQNCLFSHAQAHFKKL